MAKRLVGIIFLIMIIGAAIFSLDVITLVPDPVAITFGSQGLARNFMSRNDYRIYALLCTVGLPLIIVGVIGWAPMVFPNKSPITNQAYWLQSQHPEQALWVVNQYANGLGCTVIMFMVGIQRLVIVANQQTPPRLDNLKFVELIIGFLLSIIAWITIMVFRFRRTV